MIASRTPTRWVKFVGQSRPNQYHLIPLVRLSDLPARSDASQQGEPDETPELQTRVALTLLC
jgi:hypothetical protein